MPLSLAYLDKHIATAEEIVDALEAAILAVTAPGGAQSYTLDTGQSRQVVSKADLGSMRLQLTAAENRLSELCVRRDGASHYAR